MNQDYQNILDGLKEKIRQARQHAAITVNKQLLAMYWEIGHTILEQKKKEGWGAKVINRLAKDLKSEFPEMKGLSQRNLVYMQTFAAAYPHFSITQVPLAQTEKKTSKFTDLSITQAPLAQLSWYHHITLLDKISETQLRLYYMHKTVEHGWSRNIMLHQIESNLHLRQGAALTNFENTLAKPQSDLARETLKNPYLFDFLGMGEEMQERDLEKALTLHIKKFLLELGKGFAYVGNQYQLDVEDKAYSLDLLFYNYHLHCFVIFELKIGEFKPEYTGKLNFYINTVNEQIKSEEDKPTIGVLLCKTPNETVVRYALKGIDTPMGIAEYQLTNAVPKELQSELPTIEALEKELDKEIERNQTPLQEKISKLKNLIAKTGKEEVQKEKDTEDVRYLFNELVPRLQKEIEQNLSLLMPEFTKVEISRKINNTYSPYFMEADLEASMLKENIINLGFSLRMEGFKKGGTHAFGVWKELFIELHQFKYGVGKEQHKPWIEKLYHQKWTIEEVQILAERWCEEVIEEITEKISGLV